MHTSTGRRVGTFLIALCGAIVVHAQNPSNVEYSADSIIETEDGAVKGKIFIAPGKERREMTDAGSQMVNITRNDKKVVWMLMPEEKMYMEMPIGAGNPSTRKEELSAYKIEQTVVGPETLNGVETTKSKIIMSDKDSKMGGFMWSTKEGIMLKIDAISIDKGKKDRFKMELSNLKIGKQDPALFEIPQGYQTMSMPGMDMESMKKMMQQ